jgi:hypothetical protein
MLKISILLVGAILMTPSSSVLAGDYEVEGYADGEYVYGEVESQSGGREVEGYVYDQEGNATYFEGEWSGSGEIEGYDQEGRYIELEVD